MLRLRLRCVAKRSLVGLTARPSCWPSSFHRFFDAIFNPSWLDFASQLGSPNPPKSMKNRCQDAFSCWPSFWIDFSSIFTRNFDPQILQNHAFPLGKTMFFQKIASWRWHRSLLDFEGQHASILLPKSTKILKNPILRGIQILIVFCFDFSSIWAPFWEPSWSHVGHQDSPKTHQDAARTRLGRPRRPPRHPKRSQDAPRRLQDPFLVDF